MTSHYSKTNSSILPESLVFILGTQRSGTTWLANILDSSPETLLFVEPFAPAYDIFPEFPEASFFFEHSSDYLDHLLKVEMPVRLLRYKSLIFKKSMTSAKWFWIERWLIRMAAKKPQLLPIRVQNRIRKFELLNLNRTDDNYPLYPKDRHPSVWAIKELRLAGKIPVLQTAFPGAHFILIMRHPCATVHSILNWFDKGRLGELRQDLETYLLKIEGQTISKFYKKLIAACRTATLAHKLGLYWRISYETILRQLEHYPRVKLIVYEQLALHPHETIEETFKHIGLPFSDSSKNYLTYSTTRISNSASPINTVRNSATYYKLWCEKLSEQTKRSILEITGDSFLLSYFDPFYDL